MTTLALTRKRTTSLFIKARGMCGNSVSSDLSRKHDSCERQMLQVGRAAHRTGSFSRLIPLPPWGYSIPCSIAIYFRSGNYELLSFTPSGSPVPYGGKPA
jgi:hypothetical protein